MLGDWYSNNIETEAFYGSSIPVWDFEAQLWHRGVLRNGLRLMAGFIGHHYMNIGSFGFRRTLRAQTPLNWRQRHLSVPCSVSKRSVFIYLFGIMYCSWNSAGCHMVLLQSDDRIFEILDNLWLRAIQYTFQIVFNVKIACGLDSSSLSWDCHFRPFEDLTGPFIGGSFHGRLTTRMHRNPTSLSISKRHYEARSIFCPRKKDDFVDNACIIIFYPRELFWTSSSCYENQNTFDSTILKFPLLSNKKIQKSCPERIGGRILGAMKRRRDMWRELLQVIGVNLLQEGWDKIRGHQIMPPRRALFIVCMHPLLSLEYLWLNNLQLWETGPGMSIPQAPSRLSGTSPRILVPWIQAK